MTSQKSIAIVGITEDKGKNIFHRIANSQSRFLLVSRDKKKLETLENEFAISYPQTDTELADCVKNSCWEADIIILAVCDFDEEEMIGLMKEVATQKIVVTLSDKNDRVKNLHLKLPFSRLVNVDLSTDDLNIQGDDKEAVREIRKLFQPLAINQ